MIINFDIFLALIYIVCAAGVCVPFSIKMFVEKAPQLGILITICGILMMILASLMMQVGIEKLIEIKMTSMNLILQ